MNGLLKKLWASSASLISAGFLMLAALAVALVGLIADPRTITGAPAWLKPAKFAISTGIYGYPVELAAHVAITSTAEALERAANVREVKFVLFDAGTLRHFHNVAMAYAKSKSLRMDSYHAP